MPEDAKSKDLFYLRPLEEVKDDEGIWYYSAPVGQNKLSKMVSEMCKLAEIPGHHTNHSLRATGATELYTAGVPEKIIQEHTGHHSVECLHMYECTSDKQQHAVLNILSSSSELMQLPIRNEKARNVWDSCNFTLIDNHPKHDFQQLPSEHHL